MALARRRALLRADVPAVLRHGRACPGHPRSFPPRARTWIPGTRPGMTVMGRCIAYGVVRIATTRASNVVMAARGHEALLRASPGHDGDGAVRRLRSSRLDYFLSDLLRCDPNDILRIFCGGMAHALDRECLGGAGSGAARLFSCARDVSLDQAARPQDLSQFDRKSQRFGCACRQSGAL